MGEFVAALNWNNLCAHQLLSSITTVGSMCCKKLSGARQSLQTHVSAGVLTVHLCEVEFSWEHLLRLGRLHLGIWTGIRDGLYSPPPLLTSESKGMILPSKLLFMQCEKVDYRGKENWLQ